MLLVFNVFLITKISAMINEVQNEIDGSFKPCFKRIKTMFQCLNDTFLLIKTWSKKSLIQLQHKQAPLALLVSLAKVFHF